MERYVDPEWEAILARQGWTQFEAMWNDATGWTEPRNDHRGGWSGVVRRELKGTDETTQGVYLKRQENYLIRTATHPLAGIPTFEREFQNLRRFADAGLPVPRPVFFEKRKVAGKWQAILVTAEATGYRSLSAVLESWKQNPPPRRQRLAFIAALARLVRTLHDRGFQHNSLFPKHLLIRFDSDQTPHFKILDLEKSRRAWHVFFARRKDLGTLNRQLFYLKSTDRAYFLKSYLEGGGGDRPDWRRLWKLLEKRFLARHGAPAKKSA